MSHNGAASAPPHGRWNFAAFVANDTFSWAALTFVSVSAVLPALARQLTDSAPLIGLTSTVFYGGWYLPQLGAARLIQDRPQKMPTVYATLGGRVAFWAVAAALYARLDRRPAVMLVVLIAAVAGWAVTDSLLSLAAIDIFARAVPEHWRGRAIGAGQFLGGLAGVGVGALVGRLLSERGPGFPYNYALLFVLAGVTFIPASLALVLVREPPPVAVSGGGEQRTGGTWRHILGTDRRFGWLLLSRVLLGLANLATPFYVGHAAQVLGLPEHVIGSFVMAQMVAWVVTSLVAGLVSDRWGPRHVMALAGAAATLGPLFALMTHLTGAEWLAKGYAFVYVTLGVFTSAIWLGFLNVLLATVPDATRPTYVGLANTIVGLLTLAPVLGGWLLEVTSYPVLFGSAAVFAALGFGLALSLKTPSRVAPMVSVTADGSGVLG